MNLAPYAANVAFIWAAVIFYRTNHYYLDFLKPQTQEVLFALASAYTILGFIYYLAFPQMITPNNKSTIVLRTLKRLLIHSHTYIKNIGRNPRQPLPKISDYERTSLLFMIVKLLYIPMMINFFFGNLWEVNNFYALLTTGTSLDIHTFNEIIAPILIYLFLMIDSLFFAFGYCFEASFLKNNVKSVEPTFLGWAVALVCYPPFNNLFSQFAVWFPDNLARFPTEPQTFLLRIGVVTMYGIYLWASLGLFTKCSNLTNRGIVSAGPYRYIRHPAYIAKNLAWWLTLLPMMNFTVFMNMIVWSFIYYSRAITEEIHLIKDPEYQEYCKEVRHRFIPYIW